MIFHIQSDSDGAPDHPSSAAADFSAAQIRHNQEAKRKGLALATKALPKKACECGGHLQEDGVDSQTERPPAGKPNKAKVGTHKGFEIHATLNSNGKVYYLKHPKLGAMGHTTDLPKLKKQIDKMVKIHGDSPVLEP